MDFQQAALGIVAYGSVNGATGLSPDLNSGVTTSRGSTGQYTITFPPELFQPGTREITLIQIKGSEPLFHTCNVNDNFDPVKLVFIGLDAHTPVDSDFSFIVFRSLITPPPGAPA
jgi:hypothetical protein